mmetsp:Transcript_61373/g.168496  ORF Transcript_61373/g.168496 Transcript_61373/m.168496 type:complete len:95 (-) Transcript_61373:108-392(-)|eukprot:CAMPEP_0119477218 /NCGR_PEP_ID=MMETSP1344-20130328/7447_1 /TAXON_ID=236787 /ORGANISM="Florenciella parvula, Strain CCMP2471" /LENGTH=94 /DNA_ID=CAMNT_0007511169 /DNA_START=409 /DNA_END=693 /DNA_ORIENTATION=+
MAAVASTTCSEEQRNIIDMLLSAGAKTDTADNNGYTPFWAATACQNLVAMKLIRKARGMCNLRATNEEGEVAYSTWNDDNEEISDWLLSEGIEP